MVFFCLGYYRCRRCRVGGLGLSCRGCARGGDYEIGLCPADGVGDYLLDIGVVESAVGFVTGLEVEDFADAAEEGAAAAEDVAVLIPAREDKLIGLRDAERLAVHFLYTEVEVLRNTLSERVLGHDIPDDFALIIAPGELTGGADYVSEGLGHMRGVETYEAHAFVPDAVSYFLSEFVLDFSVAHMTPPEEDVGVAQEGVRETLIRVVERYGADFHVGILVEEFLDGAVDAVRVHRLRGGVRFFVAAFVPYCYFDLLSHDFFTSYHNVLFHIAAFRVQCRLGLRVSPRSFC